MFFHYLSKGILYDIDKDLAEIEGNIQTPGIKRLTYPTPALTRQKQDRNENVRLEKGDLKAMLLAALQVFWPVMLSSVVLFTLFIFVIAFILC